MSEIFISIVPLDPFDIGDAERRERVLSRLKEIAGPAVDVSARVNKRPVFHHSFSDFEPVRCPKCGAIIEEWADRMSDDFVVGEVREDDPFSVEGHKLDPFTTLCCSSTVRLHELVYNRPVVFGALRFYCLEPTNDCWPLSKEHLASLEDAWGGELRAVSGGH